VSLLVVLEDLSEMAHAAQLTKSGLSQDLVSQFCQSRHSKYHHWLELHVGERVLQKKIPHIYLI